MAIRTNAALHRVDAEGGGEQSGMNTHEDVGALDERDRRALEQYLSVLEDLDPVGDEDGLFLVVSQSGKEYIVDVERGSCECPDHEHRGVHCKHLRRAEFATGERTIPAAADRESIDEQLGEHVSAAPRFAGDCRAVAADGGTIVAEATGATVVLEERARPDGCECGFSSTLSCWSCYRDGFETPNPDVGSEGSI